MGKHRRDSRLCKRFQVKSGVIALDSVYGEIIDVSFGGLSFRYTAYGEMVSQPVEFGIIFGGEELFFESIALRNISDIVEDAGAEGDKAVRRRCMAFADLDTGDLIKLAHLIKRYSLDK
ncbi:hypothetical protein ACUUL3_02610 [Thiovibrio sp. JS02]